MLHLLFIRNIFINECLTLAKSIYSTFYLCPKKYFFREKFSKLNAWVSIDNPITMERIKAFFSPIDYLFRFWDSPPPYLM